MEQSACPIKIDITKGMLYKFGLVQSKLTLQRACPIKMDVTKRVLYKVWLVQSKLTLQRELCIKFGSISFGLVKGATIATRAVSGNNSNKVIVNKMFFYGFML